jgi:hypothetical protein
VIIDVAKVGGILLIIIFPTNFDGKYANTKIYSTAHRPDGKIAILEVLYHPKLAPQPLKKNIY